MASTSPAGHRAITGTLAADLTTNTSTPVIAAQGTNMRTVLTVIDVSNSHATVDTVITILDGATVKWRRFVKAAGGGFTIDDLNIIGTKNTAWNVKAETTGSAIQCSLAGYVIYDGF